MQIGNALRSFFRTLKQDVSHAQLPKVHLPRSVGDAFHVHRRPPVDLGRPPPASLESDKLYITSLYHELLHREPDPGGFQSHLTGLQNGMSREELRNVFVTSKEYRLLNTPKPPPAEPPVAPAPPAPPAVPPLGPQSSAADFHAYFDTLVARRGVGPQMTADAIARLEPDLNAVGVTLQRNSAGQIRGRIFLPTGNPSDRWSRAVDLGDFGGPWKWIAR